MIEKEDEAEKETADDSAPKLDLKFKEGQTIKVNLNIVVILNKQLISIPFSHNAVLTEKILISPESKMLGWNWDPVTAAALFFNIVIVQKQSDG